MLLTFRFNIVYSVNEEGFHHLQLILRQAGVVLCHENEGGEHDCFPHVEGGVTLLGQDRIDGDAQDVIG